MDEAAPCATVATGGGERRELFVVGSDDGLRAWVASPLEAAAWLTVAGEVDLADADQFDPALRRVGATWNHFPVVLRELTFISFAGIEVLLRYHDRNLAVLVAPPGPVRRALTLIGSAQRPITKPCSVSPDDRAESTGGAR